MGNLTEANLIPLTTELKTGQRCIRIGNSIIPVGVGGVLPAVSDSGSAVVTEDIILGVVDANGKFQPFSFDGTEASNSGSAVEVTSYKSWNSTLPAPEPAPTSSMDFYKCTYVNSNSWGGKKAVFNGTYYEFQSDSTQGLVSLGYFPKVGNIYNSKAEVFVKSLAGQYTNLMDSHTVFFLQKTLQDKASGIVITNEGLQEISSGILCTSNGYAAMAAEAFPASVLSSDTNWSVDICFTCTDVSAIPSNGSALFGRSGTKDVDRFDMLVYDYQYVIGGYGGVNYTMDTNKHVFTASHTSSNLVTIYMDGIFGYTWTVLSNIREYPIYIGYNGNDRKGYPFIIHYIRIRNTTAAFN